MLRYFYNVWFYRKINHLMRELHVKFHAKNWYCTNREAMSAILVLLISLGLINHNLVLKNQFHWIHSILIYRLVADSGLGTPICLWPKGWISMNQVELILIWQTFAKNSRNRKKNNNLMHDCIYFTTLATDPKCLPSCFMSIFSMPYYCWWTSMGNQSSWSKKDFRGRFKAQLHVSHV